ncbi:MAG: histidine kinase [Marinilabiliaceae bacterium]|nr:histidine kinase [Marinilabiliaceae bacterium]
MTTPLQQVFKLKKGKHTHLAIAAFSVLLVILINLFKQSALISEKSLFSFLLLFFQLEVFIALGRLMFQFKAGNTPHEITRNIVLRFVLYYVTCFVSAGLIFIGLLAINFLKNNIPLTQLIPHFLTHEMKHWLISTNVGLSIGAFVFFLVQWQDALKREQRLREEKLAFQFETLNNQVNPHFLFNSFNTLSSFIGSQPEIAEKYVHKLASIYRYITTNASLNSIALDREIQFIQDYFYLHKLRDEEKIDLRLSIPDAASYTIIPVSLQILIENALKHNMASKAYPLLMEVYLEDHQVVVRNKLQKISTLNTSLKKGLKKGLKNLNDRVYLHTGKRIEIIKDKQHYCVKVPLL